MTSSSAMEESGSRDSGPVSGSPTHPKAYVFIVCKKPATTVESTGAALHCLLQPPEALFSQGKPGFLTTVRKAVCATEAAAAFEFVREMF